MTKSWLYDYILVFYRRKVFCLFLIVNINFMNFFRWYSICSSLGLSQMSKLLTKTMVSQYIQQTRPSSGDWAFWRRTANWRYLYFFVTLTKLELNYIFYKLSTIQQLAQLYFNNHFIHSKCIAHVTLINDLLISNTNNYTMYWKSSWLVPPCKVFYMACPVIGEWITSWSLDIFSEILSKRLLLSFVVQRWTRYLFAQNFNSWKSYLLALIFNENEYY